MMRKLLGLWLIMPALANAAPFVVSDPQATGQTTATHCGLLLDAAAKVEVPVVLDAQGKPYCKFDVTGVTVGAHTIKATFIAKNTPWGTLESVESAPLSFSRPAIPNAPAGLLLQP